MSSSSIRVRNVTAFAVTLSLLFVLRAATGVKDESNFGDKDWDLLVFTQHWPPTVCHVWKEKNPHHTCAFPAQNNIWTIHGVWPTKVGHMGPNFCNPKWKFQASNITAIEPQMDRYWLNIEKDTPHYSFWDHEWSKHGTCAAELPTLNSEMKYFTQGLQWLQNYSMSDILSKVDIFPNNTEPLNSQEVYEKIKNSLGKNPSLHCVEDPSTGGYFIFEIRICFDKSFALVDCDGVKMEHDRFLSKDKLNHCEENKPVIYPDVVSISEESEDSLFSLVELYKLIAWLRWYTL